MPKTIHRLEMNDAELVRLRNTLVGFEHLPVSGSRVRCRYCLRAHQVIDKIEHTDACTFPVLDKLVQDAGLGG